MGPLAQRGAEPQRNDWKSEKIPSGAETVMKRTTVDQRGYSAEACQIMKDTEKTDTQYLVCTIPDF